MATAPKTRAKKAAADPTPPAPTGTNAPVITDKKLVALADQYATAAPEKNRLEKFLKEAKPVLLAAMGDAPLAYIGKRVVTRTDVVGTPDTVGEKITRAMVGQHMPGKKGRPGYTTLEVR
jgi:alkanesulfonate monooxygenase SsuD/methylene tetrahydromethanopterin reductase-like flavin-dependent oxidoreductase (luciferase family)